MKMRFFKQRLCAAIIGVIWFGFILIQLKRGRIYNSFGTLDFIEYWSAFKVYLAGGNPYDPAALLAIQQEIGRINAPALMMWNPPWNLFLLAPVLNLDWPVSVSIWLVTNVILLFFASWLTFRTFKIDGDSFSTILISSATFFPALYCLQAGQISLLLFFFSSLLFYGAIQRQHLVAGIGLAGLTLKPHLLYLVILFIVWHYCRNLTWRAVTSLLLPLVVLIGSVLLFYPTLFEQWIAGMRYPDPVLVPFQINEWLVPTVPSMIRIIIQYITGTFTFLPSLLVPLITSFGLLFYCMRSRQPLNLPIMLPTILLLNLLTTPYAWVFDFSLLLPIHIFTVTALLRTENRNRWIIGFGLLATQVLALLWSRHDLAEHHHFIWLPFLIWFWFSRFDHSNNRANLHSSNIAPAESGGGGMSSKLSRGS